MLARGARPLARASPLRDTSRVWTHSTVPCALTAENLLQVCTHLAMWHESAAEISHMHARCFSEQRNRVGCSAAPLLNINLPFFCVLSLQLHVCNVWQDAGRAPDQPRGSWEREKLGRHLITGPHQMLELFTHRAWNFVCGEMIYNFTLTAGGGGERERDAEKGEKYISSVFSLCQQIPEWFPGFDYFSFYDCNNTEGARERDESDEEHLVFSWVEELEAMVLCRCRVCMSPQNHYGTPRRPGHRARVYQRRSAIHQFLFWGKAKIDGACSQSWGLSGMFPVVAQGQQKPGFPY